VSLQSLGFYDTLIIFVHNNNNNNNNNNNKYVRKHYIKYVRRVSSMYLDV